MLVFFLATAVLIILAYYIFGSEEPGETKGASAPARRDAPARRERNDQNEKSKERSGPDIHVKKVQKKTSAAFRSATERAQNAGEKEDLKEIARESYFLAESLERMFSSSQFFEGKARFDSFRTAIKAAEDVRDRLIDRQKKEMQQADTVVPSVSGSVGDQYARNATESALMIAWCAGGLIGKSRYESAREAFRVPVSAEDVQRWEQFGQVLRKESEHHMLDPSKR